MTAPYSESERQVIDLLKRKPGITVAGLVASGISRSTVRNALIKADANGNLMTTPEWPRKFTWLDIPLARQEAEPTYLVEPDVVQPNEVGKRFIQGRPKIIKVLQDIDMTKQDQAKVLSDLEAVSRAILGIYVALGRVEDGPEWRQEAGVS